MAERLTRVAARGWYGLEFDEELPSRLLLTGRNGAGKTARLNAIRIGLSGPANKDGLQPWATSDVPSVVVEGSTGLKIQRATKISRSDGVISCANRSAVEPSQGEKTADAVAARIERELRPNAIVLSLDALFGKSGPERRRALLEALGADKALDPLALQRALDDEFVDHRSGVPTDPRPLETVVWERIRAAVRPGSFPDGFAYLAALEGAAKAQASDYRATKDAQDSLARGIAPGAAGDVDGIRRELADAQKAVDEMREARATADRGRQERERARTRKGQMAVRAVSAMREWTKEGTEVPATFFDAWGQGAISEMLRSLAKDSDTLAGQATASDAAGLKNEEEIGKLEGKEEYAAKQVARWRGRLAALDTLKEGDPHETGRCCAACGAPGFDPAKIVARIREERGLLEDATKKHRAAASALTEKRAEETRRVEEHEHIELRAGALASLQTALEMLAEADRVLAGLGADVGADAAALAAAEAHRDEVSARLEAASKADGERKAQQDAGKKADEAGAQMRRAVEIQTRVGPKGLQGELLQGPVDRLARLMTRRWNAAGKPGALAWTLTDPRGAPDATLTWLREGHGAAPMPFSSGEKGVALACLIAALAESKPDRMSVALVEAGEIDDESLVRALQALRDAPLANVVVATHLRWPVGAAAIEDATGFEIRLVGAP